jgi:predicted RNA-binding protein with PIN domain
VYYFIDGYNLLFTTTDSVKNLQIQRQTLVAWVQREFAKLRLSGSVVFDGAHRRGEESGLSYPSPLEVAYTPKGQSADEYIIEQLSIQKNCKISVVITNDMGLRRHAQAMGARTQSNESFLQWLAKKGKKKGTKGKVIKETAQQIDRLMKIFEERLKKKSTDDLEGWE